MFVKNDGLLVLLLLFISNLFASDFYDNCYLTLEDQQDAIATMREACLTFGGGGSVFNVEAPSAPVTCKITMNSGEVRVYENYYGAKFDCNTCNAADMLQTIEMYRVLCNARCRENAVKCSHDMFKWGSDLKQNGTVYGDYICGDKDPSLPGCSESSSSQDDGSSSSEELSSSSEESSSSVEESSSSKEGEESSSSEEDIDSSSSEDYDESSSSEGEGGCGEGGDHCDLNPFDYKDGLRLCHTEVTYYSNLDNVFCDWSSCGKCYASNTDVIKYFTKRPNYYGEVEFWLLCDVRQNNPTVTIQTNLPYVVEETNARAYCYDDMESCQRSKMNGDFFVRVPTIYGCRGNSMHYVVPVDPERGCSVTKNTDNDNYGIIFIGQNITETSTLASLKWLNRASEYPANFDFNKLLDEPKIVESFERCIRTLIYYNSTKSSSSQYSSSSEEGSSSSDDAESSSSFDVSLSSNEELVESSSSEHMIVYSSSSEIFDEPFIAGPDQKYSPDQIFHSGLQNMEEGKCYSLNPERGSQYGWINNNAQDSWWWVEVPCDGSMPVVEKTSAGCIGNKRGSNAVYHPSDCFSSGLDNMTPGKCYSLNPERGTQYGWINNNAQDSWWWVETPCEKENNRGLYKKVAHQVIVDDGKDELQETRVKSNLNYDALGRAMNRRNAFGENRSVYSKNRIVR